MKSKALRWVAGAVVVLAVSLSALAQDSDEVVRFSGTIGDYTLANTPSTVGGPWDVHGQWQLRVNWITFKATFTAELTMVRSDEGALAHGGLDSAAARNAHTHHIKMVGGNVTSISHGFEVTGTATLAANGKTPPNPPFSSASVPVTISITGGDLVPFSNMQLSLGGDAVGHFGSKPLLGVVKNF